MDQPAGYVHLNVANIIEELDSLERDLLVSGDQHPLHRIKQLLPTKPYYMASVTQRVLADYHAMPDTIVVSTAHGACYVLRRVPNPYGESAQYTSGKLRAWLSDTPLVRERCWEPCDERPDGAPGDYDYRPHLSVNSLEKSRVKEWVTSFPYRGAYTKKLPARWRSVVRYYGLCIEPGIEEDYISAYDYDHYIYPLYSSRLADRADPYGKIVDVADVDEAFTLAEELREHLNEGDIACRPVVHVGGLTDCEPPQSELPQRDEQLEAPVEKRPVRAFEQDLQRVISKAGSLDAMRTEVQKLEHKLRTENLHGKRREHVQRELEDARKSLAQTRRNLLSFSADEICDALLASESAHNGLL